MEGTAFLQNSRNYLPIDAVSYPRKLESSAVVLWETSTLIQVTRVKWHIDIQNVHFIYALLKVYEFISFSHFSAEKVKLALAMHEGI